jgi:hypothetical protein
VQLKEQQFQRWRQDAVQYGKGVYRRGDLLTFADLNRAYFNCYSRGVECENQHIVKLDPVPHLAHLCKELPLGLPSETEVIIAVFNNTYHHNAVGDGGSTKTGRVAGGEAEVEGTEHEEERGVGDLDSMTVNEMIVESELEELPDEDHTPAQLFSPVSDSEQQFDVQSVLAKLEDPISQVSGVCTGRKAAMPQDNSSSVC